MRPDSGKHTAEDKVPTVVLKDRTVQTDSNCGMNDDL